MQPADATILRESSDGLLLKRTLLRILRAPAPGDVAVVLAALASEPFLLRLDDAEAYGSVPGNLRLAKVLRGLADAPDAQCREALVALTGKEAFVAHPLRVKLLIGMLARCRPPDPAAIAFWSAHAGADSSLATDVALATTLNGRREALQVFGRMLLDEGHPQSLRVSWLRRFLLPIRDDEQVLRMSRSLLERWSGAPMAAKLLEVLFRFEPDRWYRSCRHPGPPDRRLASAPSRELLLQIAERHAADRTLPRDLRETLRDARDTLREERQET